MRGRTRGAALIASLALVATGCAGGGDSTTNRTLPVALPSLTLDGFDGGPDQALDELRGPMVINLWATWCAPCRDELPVLQEFSQAHGDRVEMVGIDWRVPLDVARTRVPERCALQGNLDPATVLAGWPATKIAAADVLKRNNGHLGHVFNLGHGVLPETDPAILEQLVAWVHEQPVTGPTPTGTDT